MRDNASGNIGFLNDLRRMNVAITRARMKLIVFGNAETMSKTKFYEKLVEYFQQRGDFVIVQSDEPPTISSNSETSEQSWLFHKSWKSYLFFTTNEDIARADTL